MASACSAQSPSLVVVGRDPLAASTSSFVGETLTFLAATKTDGATEPLVVDVADLVSWGAPSDLGRGAYIVFCDGGVLAVDKITMSAERLDFISPACGTHSLPLANVRGIVFRSSATARERERLVALLRYGPSGDRDRVILLGGDELVGTLTMLDEREAAIDTSIGPAKIEAGRPAAVIFNPSLAVMPVEPTPRLLVGLRDGSLLTATALASNGTWVGLTLPIVSPEVVQPDSAAPWSVSSNEIVSLQTLGGRATYLSDLTPSGYKYVPYLELSRPYHLDANSSGGPLRTGGRRYLKGIGMHSTSRLTFPLEAAQKKFAAEIAIDDNAEGRGSVTFRVFVDAQERYASPIVRGGDSPTPIEIDVSGGRTLSLVVDFAERGDELDHADWLDARLTP